MYSIVEEELCECEKFLCLSCNNTCLIPSLLSLQSSHSPRDHSCQLDTRTRTPGPHKIFLGVTNIFPDNTRLITWYGAGAELFLRVAAIVSGDKLQELGLPSFMISQFNTASVNRSRRDTDNKPRTIWTLIPSHFYSVVADINSAKLFTVQPKVATAVWRQFRDDNHKLSAAGHWRSHGPAPAPPNLSIQDAMKLRSPLYFDCKQIRLP